MSDEEKRCDLYRLGSWVIIILITSKVIHKPRKNKSYSKDST